MKYIIDIKNDTPVEEINAWVAENNHTIVHTFDHFEKLYIVETDEILVLPEFVEHAIIDDHSTAVKLHLFPGSFTLNTEDESEWWKTVVLYDALETETAEVIRRGQGYAVYLMDSGVNALHEDFVDTEVRQIFSHVEDPADNSGHGTALASVISGKKTGITSAEIVSVKIFEHGVPTMISDILKALDQIALDYLEKYVGKPAIINMSWTIDKNEFVEDKIRSLLKLGLLAVVAAGNSGIPIKDATPASMPEVATIGSIGINLQPSNFSDYTGGSSISYTAGETNYSPGLDYWCPGESIMAAYREGGFYNVAGTSIATAIATATMIYQFSKISLEYGKIYPNKGYGMYDQMREDTYVEATIESLASELLTPLGRNPFIPSRAIVDLTEKYINCTNRVPVVYGVYDDNMNSDVPWVQAVTYVKKGIPTIQHIFDHHYVDSASIAELPEGLVLQPDGYLVGTTNVEVGEDKYKLFNSTLTLTRGETVVEHPFQIIYMDISVINEEFSENDYHDLITSDSNLQVQVYCQDCGPSTYYCSQKCFACYDCGTPKDMYYMCSPVNAC